MGAPALISRLSTTPVKALLVVDLPFGEEPQFEQALREAGYPMIPLLTPTTTLARARRCLQERADPGIGAPFAQRFAYLVARLGVTGSGAAPDLGPIAERVKQLRTLGERPLAVGFGLSDPAMLQAVRVLGVTPVVGSALVQELADGKSLREALQPRLVRDK
jgi:tryptophan synthase alpha chain